MADPEIPNRALFKQAEVCELAKLQPYVLRSWESEFADLGVSKSPGAPRVYRRSDVERVLRIKQLVFAEGLTLAGVRRRLDEESAPVPPDTPIEELFGRHARERLALVRNGLRSLLDLLSREPGQEGGYELKPPAAVRRIPPTRERGKPAKTAAKKKRAS